MFDVLVNLYERMGFLGSAITGIIVAVFISGFYINILVRRKFISLSEELAAYCAGSINEFRSEMLAWITEEYKASLNSGVESINTQAIVDVAMEAFQKPWLLCEGYLKRVNGILITTGLFGTFLGLTSAIGNMGTIMAETGAEELMTEAGINTFKVLVSSFQGMSVAFTTSLLGTGFSILFSLLMSFLGSNNEKRLFMSQLEEYLDNKLVTESAEARTNAVKSYLEELKSLESFNKEFRQNIDLAKESISSLAQTFDKTSEEFHRCGLNLYSCYEELQSLVKEAGEYSLSLKGLDESIKMLNSSLDHSIKDREIFLKTINEIPDRLLNYSEAAYARIERGR